MNRFCWQLYMYMNKLCKHKTETLHRGWGWEWGGVGLGFDSLPPFFLKRLSSEFFWSSVNNYNKISYKNVKSRKEIRRTIQPPFLN